VDGIARRERGLREKQTAPKTAAQKKAVLSVGWEREKTRGGSWNKTEEEKNRFGRTSGHILGTGKEGLE